VKPFSVLVPISARRYEGGVLKVMLHISGQVLPYVVAGGSVPVVRPEVRTACRGQRR
jgi:hypothetical protein